MIFNSIDINSFLILAPHPDDESLGCAGTAFLLKNKGVSSYIAFITSGEKLLGEASQNIAEKRILEAKKSSNILNCKESFFLDIPDGEIGLNKSLLFEKLFKIINLLKPDMIFSPSPLDYHQDHIATARVCLKLQQKLNSFRLAFYEIYSTIRFTHLIDITNVIERKKELIMNYQISFYGNPEIYVHASLGLSAQRSIFTQRKGYYEAFYVIDKNIDSEKILDWIVYGDTKFC